MAKIGNPPFLLEGLEPPIAQRQPVGIEQHGITRVDDYGWLRDDNWQAVLRDPQQLDAPIRKHLEAENSYYSAATSDLEVLRTTLFEEMRGRTKEDDSTVPAVDGPYAYAVRHRQGGEYPIFVRAPRNGGEETILFDGDEEGAGAPFFRIASVMHSPNHEWIAYAVDRLGSEYYDIRIRNVATGEESPETIRSTGGDSVWSADSGSLYYVERDDNQRPRRVMHHVVGTDPAGDIVVYEEADESYFVGIGLSQSTQYLFIGSTKGTSSEYRFLPADAEPGAEPKLIAPRTDNLLYHPEHWGDYFMIRTNADEAVDFKIVRTPVAAPGKDNWKDWIGHESGTYISGMLVLANWLVRLERKDALPRIVVSDYSGSISYNIDFSEAAYNLELSEGYEFTTDTLRFTYESPSTPDQTYDFNLRTRDRVLRKSKKVPSGHNADLYEVERLVITASDGAEIPVTVLRLKSTPLDGSAPLLLYGYGSYGLTMQAWFQPNILSLVDRGVVYATAHVRGSSAKGRQWYLDGKLDKKKNTFSDFAAVAEELQERGYGARGETVIYGGSAGGLLVGATLNLRPELFGGAIAAVPFVDVLNTISDAELPLTPPEWVEWGDPINDPQACATISAYSPYDNLRTDADYPPVLATGGLTDYRVTYWEPAKWIARLRAEAKGGPFFLRMDLEAGHGGSAARFERLRQLADDYSFALRLFGLTRQSPVSHQARRDA